MLGMTSSPKKTNIKPQSRKTAQATIPYKRVYADDNTNGGIIETENGIFTKSYYLEDTNYSGTSDENQEKMLKKYETILNSFNELDSYEITINNRNIDQKEFKESVLMKYAGDKYDAYRKENNDLYLQYMQEGRNCIRPEIYLTIATPAENIREAVNKFINIEKTLHQKFAEINGTGLAALSLEQRLEILHDIFNLGQEGSFLRTKSVDGKELKAFDLDAIKKQGLTTKDIIAPPYFEFDMNYAMIGEKYARAMYLKNIPSQLPSTFMENLASVSANMLISVHYQAMSQDKAARFAADQVTTIGGDIVKAQRKLSESGVSVDLISPKLANAKRDSDEMLDDITNNGMRLIYTTVVILVFADTKEDLELYTEQVKSRARAVVCNIDTFLTQQEQGFITALPLALNKVFTYRVMTGYTASAIQPFASRELFHKSGLVYGVNTQTRNLIKYDRRKAANQNGVYLGIPGKGKSLAAKNEIQQILLTMPDAVVYIIDPEGEYGHFAETFGGQVIKVAPGGKNIINPMDYTITTDGDRDPKSEKSDYIMSLVEKMIGGEGSLNSAAKAKIDAALTELYQPYEEYLRQNGLTYDKDKCPCLKDLYDNLRASSDETARTLAASMQIYCVGSLNLFAGKTNIDISNSRIIVYDISNIGTNLKDIGMFVCLNDVWNNTIENKARNVRTWFYIDEFYLVLKQPRSAQFLQMVWKRARKWGGVPTGLTQNVSDLLNSDEGVNILSTSSECALLLSQAPLDLMQLAQIYKISDEQIQYVTDAPPGSGLLVTANGKTTIPFTSKIPSDTEIFKLMTTKFEDK